MGQQTTGVRRDLPTVIPTLDVAASTRERALLRRRLVTTDAVAVTVGVAAAYVVRFDVTGATTVAGDFAPTYLSVSLVLAVAWMAALALTHSRDHRLMGTGLAEYGRVFAASWRLFALVAVVAYLLKMDVGRGYLGFAFPLGLTFLLATRFLWRRRLHRARAAGRFQSGMVVIGHPDKVARLVDELGRTSEAGYTVVGACVPREEMPVDGRVAGVPVLGSIDDAAAIASEVGASAVAVAGSDAITAEVVHALGWDLEGKNIDLVLTVALTDVAGPRVILQPIAGLPLMYVDEARFTGGKYVAKSLLDYVGAALAVLVLSPLLVVVALLVVTTSRGPVFYTQERVGRDGRGFRMVKFRSMVVDAHDRLAEVLAAEGSDGVALYYKPRNDPRVTRVGAVLRRYSLDELPQLFNVLRGEMSLVGPRPQIAAEVAQYDHAAHRRLRVKPGLTGLWQVSGRSNVSPEEAMRMDVSYVENWTVFGDLLIIARTLSVVVAGRGAR